MFLAFLLSTLAWSAELDLKGTLAHAIENSPGLQSSKRDVEIRSLELKNARANLYPSFDFSSRHGMTESATRSSPYVSTMSLTATETLYDNGITLSKIDSAQIELDLARAKFNDERDRLALQVAEEFFRYSLSTALLGVQTAQLGLVKKQYEGISAQYRSGIKTRKDYLKMHSEVRRTEIDLETAKGNLDKSRLELLRLIGVNPQNSDLTFQALKVQPKEIRKPPEAPPQGSGHALFKTFELQSRLAQIDRELVRRLVWPEVTLTAGADLTASDYLGTGNAFPGQKTSGWNALLGLKFNLWDWGIRRRNLEVASHKQSQVELDLQAKRLQFSADGLKAYQDFSLGYRNFLLSQELLDLESKSYALVEADYRGGKVSFWDLTYGLRDLLEAKVKMYTNYFNVKLNQLKYLYHEGRLNDEFSQI